MMRRSILVVAGAAALGLATLAMPVPTWRTGELWAPPLAVVEGGPAVNLPERVWIDTDAACGHARTADPDDCLSLLLLVRTLTLDVVGISTVFGNAPLEVTDETTRTLMALLKRDGVDIPPVHRGSAESAGQSQKAIPQPAHAALREALAEGPLTVIALGPLTNVAAALEGRPDLERNVGRLIAVMGRRPGHLFHPSEGSGGGMLFGHGPVFRDFNFDMDRPAAKAVIEMHLPVTLMPYEAARDISLTGRDLDRLANVGGAAAWIASRARAWLDFWVEDIGRDGFYPFDLLAAAYVIQPGFFNCAETAAWVSKDDELWNLPLFDPPALLVGRKDEQRQQVQNNTAVYCPEIDGGLHEWVMARLGSRQRDVRLSAERDSNPD